jgi:hypothetical protein
MLGSLAGRPLDEGDLRRLLGSFQNCGGIRAYVHLRYALWPCRHQWGRPEVGEASFPRLSRLRLSSKIEESSFVDVQTRAAARRISAVGRGRCSPTRSAVAKPLVLVRRRNAVA